MEIRPETRAVPGSEPTKGDREDYGTAHGRSSFELDIHTNGEEQRLLKLAGSLLVRARDFESRITAIETASQACKCARTVSATIVEILEKAKVLLSRMREIADPEGRRVMAKSYDDIIKQIDSIADAGYYDSNNLARADNIEITIDTLRREGFEIAGIDMSCSGLDLKPFESGHVSNADIIERLSKVETASSNLIAHSFSYDSLAVLLQSRIKFARGMVDILEEGNHQINSSRAGHDAIARAVSQICSKIDDEDPARMARHRDNNLAGRDRNGFRDPANGRA